MTGEGAAAAAAKRGALHAGDWRDLRIALRMAKRASCAAVTVKHVTVHLGVRVSAPEAQAHAHAAHQPCARGSSRGARAAADGSTAAMRGGGSARAAPRRRVVVADGLQAHAAAPHAAGGGAAAASCSSMDAPLGQEALQDVAGAMRADTAPPQPARARRSAARLLAYNSKWFVALHLQFLLRRRLRAVALIPPQQPPPTWADVARAKRARAPPESVACEGKRGWLVLSGGGAEGPTATISSASKRVRAASSECASAALTGGARRAAAGADSPRGGLRSGVVRSPIVKRRGPRWASHSLL